MELNLDSINHYYKYKIIVELKINELIFEEDQENKLFIISNISSLNLEKIINKKKCNPMIKMIFPLDHYQYIFQKNKKNKYQFLLTVDMK